MSVMFLPRLSGCASRAGEAIVYPATVDAVMPAMTDFAVTVNGSPSPVYGAKIGLDHSYIAVPGVISTEVVGFTGFDITGPVTAVVAGTPVVTNTGAGTTMPSVTPYVSGSALYIVALHWSVNYTATAPGGYANTTYTESGTTSSSAMLSTARVIKTVASESPGDYTMSVSGGSRVGGTICICSA